MNSDSRAGKTAEHLLIGGVIALAGIAVFLIWQWRRAYPAVLLSLPPRVQSDSRFPDVAALCGNICLVREGEGFQLAELDLQEPENGLSGFAYKQIWLADVSIVVTDPQGGVYYFKGMIPHPEVDPFADPRVESISAWYRVSMQGEVAKWTDPIPEGSPAQPPEQFFTEWKGAHPARQ